MAAIAGVRHYKWNGGKGLNEKGYVRIWAGPHRGKYEHRLAMMSLLSNPIGLPFVGCDGVIPENMTVEHIDHNRTHNCHVNLMLLQKEIHDYISFDTLRVRERLMAEFIDQSDW